MSEPIALEIRGRFTDRVVGMDGAVWARGAAQDRGWVNNLIVERALDLLAALLSGQAGTRGILYWAVGEGEEEWDALPPDTDPKTKRLVREIYRKPLDAARDMAYDPTTRTISLRVTFRPDEAVGLLREFGIFGGDATETADSGYLINYKIHALIDKTLPRGLERHLEFTIGPAPDVVVPNLVGKVLSAAQAMLDPLSLGVGAITLQESEDAADTVVSQFPAEGARVAVGIGVDLTLTSPITVVVPDLTGLTRSRAIEVLATIGLVLDELPLFEQSAALPGTIVHQNPVAGARLARASRVIVVQAEPRTTVVPDVKGMELEGAQTELARARLRLTQEPAAEENGEVSPGVIVAQTPAAGGTTEVDTIVQVTVSAPPTVSVPNLDGLDADAAGKALAEAGLAFGGLTQAASDTPVGLVFQQTPGAGLRVTGGSTVDIVLAIPLAMVTPGVIGLTFEKAKEALDHVGLVLGDKPTRRTSNLPTNTIIEQDPPVGAPTGKGAILRVVLADAVMLLMPKLAGRLLDEARELIKGASLKLVEPPQEVDEPDVKVGTVLAQVPEEGSRIAEGTEVTLTVSAPRVNVPNLNNLTQVQALPILQEFDLLLDAEITQKGTTNTELDGRIAEQTPAANARVAPGSRVKIVLWQVERVIVPNVVGMTHADAAAELKRAGLAQDAQLTKATDKASDVGRVAAQFPKANERVLRGQLVQLTLWVAQLVKVPGVLGMKSEDARQTLARVGLELVRSNQLVDNVQQQDVVLSQQPEAGAQLEPGGVVNAAVGTFVVFPELRCRNREEAEAFLNEYMRKFEVDWDRAISVAFQPSFEEPNVIVAQTPAMGSPIVGALGNVGVTVRRAPLPDVRFLPFDRAIDVLKSWSDTNGGVIIDFRTREVASDRESRTILAQKPEALSADYPERGLVMDLALAGPRTNPLRGFPDVMGLDMTAAAKRIAVYARTIPTIPFRTRVGDIASERPDNMVLEQTPAPGGTPFGELVTLRIARTLFPDVLCQNLDKAQEMIKEATPGRTVNFTVDKQVSGLEPGTVIAQTPLPLAAIPAVESTMEVVLIVAG